MTRAVDPAYIKRLCHHITNGKHARHTRAKALRPLRKTRHFHAAIYSWHYKCLADKTVVITNSAKLVSLFFFSQKSCLLQTSPPVTTIRQDSSAVLHHTFSRREIYSVKELQAKFSLDEIRYSCKPVSLKYSTSRLITRIKTVDELAGRTAESWCWCSRTQYNIDLTTVRLKLNRRQNIDVNDISFAWNISILSALSSCLNELWTLHICNLSLPTVVRNLQFSWTQVTLVEA